MKRVLIITYYWPPSGGSGVQRWVKFVKYLPSCGWQPVVLAPENPEYTTLDKTLLDDIPAEAEVLHLPIREPYTLYRKIMGKNASTDLKTVVTPITSGKKNWKQKLSLWIRGNLFVPDPRVGWRHPAVRFLKKYLKEHPVDAVVTTGPPHSMHLIGLKLHQETGVPWIPDFRDPWTKLHNLRYLSMTRCTWKKLHRMEQQVLDNSSAVLTVTPLVQEDYRKMTSTPVYMIPNGFDGEDFKAPVHFDGYFNITQTGVMSADGNPSAFWKILGAKAARDEEFRSALRIRFCGVIDAPVLEEIKREGLEPNLVLLGYRSHAEAILEQRQASLLLLPLRDAPEMKIILPGKLFEYLAARRPVLGFGQSDGAQARLLQETGAGITADWTDTKAMEDFLEKAWAAHKAGGVPATTGNIDQYERRALTRELAALLEKV